MTDKSDESQMFDFGVLRELRKRQGLTISHVSAKSGISPAVISKLERNQSNAELETIFRLSRVFGMNTADLITLSESRAAHHKSESNYSHDGFSFRRVSYGNMRCIFASARAGSRLSTPEIHRDDYELCWVLDGRVAIQLPNESHELSKGDALQFDAIQLHSYEVIEDCKLIIVHQTKQKRF